VDEKQFKKTKKVALIVIPGDAKLTGLTTGGIA